jgi:hypothetical protein
VARIVEALMAQPRILQRRLEAPRRVSWLDRCSAQCREIQAVLLPQSTGMQTVLQLAFSMPAQGCKRHVGNGERATTLPRFRLKDLQLMVDAL